MIHRCEKLSNLYDVEALEKSQAVLISNIIENSSEINEKYKRPAVIICPGGGYEFLSDREGQVVADRFAASDISAFILNYSIEKEKVYPIQLLELSAALAYVRKNAEEFNIDKDKIIVCGFSAGGHLAADLGVSWQREEIRKQLELNYGDNKPNGMILAYPVITAGEYAHKSSFTNLLGHEVTEDDYDDVSLEMMVSKNTPTTFIWHTFEDGTVPVENTLFFANALKRENIPFEMHIYPKGGHGLSLADKSSANINDKGHINKHVATWFDLAIQWIEVVFNNNL